MADGPRLIFRSSHIYLLWASLLNLALGCYLPRLSSSLPKFAQLAGCVAVLLGPALLCWSFFFEPYSPELSRPVGRWAIYLALAGTAMHVLASLRSSSLGSDDGERAADDNEGQRRGGTV